MGFKLHNSAKTAILMGIAFALLSVVLGAFAAHGLKNMLDDYHLSLVETASRYQMYHGLGLVVIGFLAGRNSSVWFEYSIWLMALGILFFCGSLYALALTSISALGMVAPVGGLFFILAWIGCFIGVLKS